MGSDMIVALKEASANGTTLFGINHHAAPTQHYHLQRFLGRTHNAGEVLHTSMLKLPQVRQTYSVLGMQPAGSWGFTHGVNEHHVVTGVTHWKSRMGSEPLGMTGPDLVRLALERSRNAHQAVEVLTDLIWRHGQGSSAGQGMLQDDHIFLIADRDEAFVLEACGRYWALLESRDTRVVTDAAMIRQDWRRLAPGLADFVIQHGWWHDDGSKIDFVRCLGESTDQTKAAQRRWGRASLALAQQLGAIDLHFLRSMLEGHYEQNLELLPGSPGVELAHSFVVDLQKTDLPILAWFAFGTPQASAYFPVCLLGELPCAWTGRHPEFPTIQARTQELEKLALGKPKDRAKLTQALERLQTRFDQDAEEFLVKAHDFQLQGNTLHLEQLATEMMHNHVELFEKEYRRMFNIEEKPAQPVYASEEMLFFA